MNAQILIDSIVRQVTVLIAQLATSGGIRAPLSHLANQVFLELANELEAQGVSRKVSADMFGMALRAYVRKVRHLSEGETEQGRTLWQGVLDYIETEGFVTREQVVERFRRDRELEVSAVLRDLTESGLAFSTGSGRNAVYRLATEDELQRLSRLTSKSGHDELAWVLTYRHGPITAAELAKLLRQDDTTTAETLERLRDVGRVRQASSGQWLAQDFVIPLGSSVGWEAAVFDHVQAVVQTVCQRLRQTTSDSEPAYPVGCSTYSFDIWPGHPLEKRVKDQLATLREQLGAMRREVSDFNDKHDLPTDIEQVVTYVGQCVIERELGSEDGETGT